ncbi:MAG: ecotin family protein [Vulcanococcus sp.]
MLRWDWARPLPWLAAVAAALLAAAPAGLAIPRLDLSRYPQPAPGQRRWVIQLPGLLPPSPAGAVASDPRSWRVQLVVGQEMSVDCNIHQLSGKLQASDLPGWGSPIYRLEGANAGQSIASRMACPPGQPRRQGFVSLAGGPFLVPYNVSLPIVVDLPQALQLRWRLWRPMEPLQPAQAL